MTRSARIRARRVARQPRFTVRDGVGIGVGIVIAVLAVIGFGAVCMAFLGAGVLAVL